MSAKKSFLLSLIISIFIAGPAEAKSVYVITDHHTGTLRAYEIQGDKLVKPYWNQGVFDEAVDVTIDLNLKLLFITFEASNIVWADAETLEKKGSLSTPTMAGIVADEQKQRVYAVERGGNNLYVCEWDRNTEQLVLVNTVTLANLSGAMGIALDKNTRQLYVGNNTPNVHYYDADDPNWAHLGTRNVGRNVADITIDCYRRFLYAGSLYTGSGGHNYLVKHNLECESNCNTETNIETVPIGVAVDSATGLVYCTTADYQVRVYDCSGPNCICTDSEPTGGSSGPAGICVESALVQLTKIDVNEPNCVGPGDYITYTICYSYPNEPNCPDYNDVNIIDNLPSEVTYRSSDPYGFYDCNSNTVRWNIGNLSPGSGNSVKLKVRMKCPNPGSIITNYCEIKCGEDVLNSAYEHTPVCATPGVLYYDNFNGPNGVSLNGTMPDITTGGATWQAGSWVDSDGYYGGGVAGQMFTAALPFTPSIGTVYELSATFDNQGDWVAIGFLDVLGNLETRFLDNSPYLWSLARESGSTAKDMSFIGPGNTNGLGNTTTSSAAEMKVRIEMNSETNWLVTWYFDGSPEFQETIDPIASSIELNYVAFGSNGFYSPVTGTISSFTLVEIPHPDRICILELKPAGDLTCDCLIDFRDFAVIADEWFDRGCSEADLHKDGKVDFKDLAIMVDNWLKEKLFPLS